MNEETREMMERALKRFFPKSIAWSQEQTGRVFDALAESKDVIAKKVEIIHLPASNGYPAMTAIETGSQTFYIDGIHGTPGPYLFIGLPLPPEGEE